MSKYPLPSIFTWLQTTSPCLSLSTCLAPAKPGLQLSKPTPGFFSYAPSSWLAAGLSGMTSPYLDVPNRARNSRLTASFFIVVDVCGMGQTGPFPPAGWTLSLSLLLGLPGAHLGTTFVPAGSPIDRFATREYGVAALRILFFSFLYRESFTLALTCTRQFTSSPSLALFFLFMFLFF